MPLRVLIWTAVSTRGQTAEDKHSLPIQEEDGRNFALAEGGTVVDVLRVPGHSRRYKDFAELAEQAARKGIPAFRQLEAHWRARDFDVLWVRAGDRFARTQSLHARITEEIIDAGARIYSAADGWVDRHNYRMWTAMGGYSASASVDQLVRLGRATKDAKAQIGLAINARPIWCYRVLRTELGRIRAVERDETKEAVVRDAARLVLEGVAWHDVERVLAARFGHANGDKPFHNHFFYWLFHNPFFWGNSARRWKGAASAHGRQWDAWVFDAASPAPDGVLIYYGTHRPYLDDELGLALKAELLRRRSSVRGSNRPHRSRMFSGLLVCAHCGHYLIWMHNNHGRAYYRCATTINAVDRALCPGQYVREDRLAAWFDARLRRMVATADPLLLLSEGRDDGAGDAAALRARVGELRRQVGRLIAKQASADDSVRDLYDEQIGATAAQLKTLQRRLDEADRATNVAERQQAEGGHQALAQAGVDAFWTWPPVAINQLLHRLMGRRRVAIPPGSDDWRLVER